jgi:hypothetical protein
MEKRAVETGQSEDRGNDTSVAGCLVPAFWMLAGNGILAICALAMIGKGFAVGLLDAFYWLTVCGLIGARYADIRYLGGRTAEGAPATMAHWRRYTVIVVVVSAVLWGAIHLVPDVGL